MHYILNVMRRVCCGWGVFLIVNRGEEAFFLFGCYRRFEVVGDTCEFVALHVTSLRELTEATTNLFLALLRLCSTTSRAPHPAEPALLRQVFRPLQASSLQFKLGLKGLRRCWRCED